MTKTSGNAINDKCRTRFEKIFPSLSSTEDIAATLIAVAKQGELEKNRAGRSKEPIGKQEALANQKMTQQN